MFYNKRLKFIAITYDRIQIDHLMFNLGHIDMAAPLDGAQQRG